MKTLVRVATSLFLAFTLHAPLIAGDHDALIAQAFVRSHQGFSVDEVLLDEERRQAFHQACRQLGVSDTAEREMNATLLRLRKAGKLEAKATQRGRRPKNRYKFAAELAARLVTDRHQVTTDTILCDPELRAELLREAQRVDADASEYDVLKWMLNLRKARRLRPELVLRVIDWQREIKVWDLQALQADPTLVPENPGIYLFRDASGYLYVGEAKNLRERLAEHVSGSDRKSLANYLNATSSPEITVETHAFAVDSPAKHVTMRRAYESELISSRQPRFNIRP